MSFIHDMVSTLPKCSQLFLLVIVGYQGDVCGRVIGKMGSSGQNHDLIADFDQVGVRTIG